MSESKIAPKKHIKRKPAISAELCAPKLISLFSGGGLDLGLEAAGFETIFATDIDTHSCLTLKAGKAKAAELGLPFLQSAKVVQADILEFSPAEIMKEAGVQPGEVDLLAGGPPCQAFSIFGRRQGENDPRGKLYREYLRILAEVKPKAFIFESGPAHAQGLNPDYPLAFSRGHRNDRRVV